MSRAVSAVALPARPSTIPGFAVPARGLESALERALAAFGDGVRIAWWDGSAIGLRLNGLLGLFEADLPARTPDRAGGRA